MGTKQSAQVCPVLPAKEVGIDIHNRKGSTSKRSGRNTSSRRLKRQQALVVKIMLPLYYTEETLRSEDVQVASASWNMILFDKCSHFHSNKMNLTCLTSREWFERSFYERLFDVHPFCKPMFTNPSSQGKFLTGLFSFIFTVIDQEEQFNERLIQLARSHAAMHVRPVEYAIIGEVLFHTLKKCLGSSYTQKVHEAWVKLFSKMLSVIVPEALSCEMDTNPRQSQQIAKFFMETYTSVYKSRKSISCPASHKTDDRVAKLRNGSVSNRNSNSNSAASSGKGQFLSIGHHLFGLSIKNGPTVEAFAAAFSDLEVLQERTDSRKAEVNEPAPAPQLPAQYAST